MRRILTAACAAIILISVAAHAAIGTLSTQAGQVNSVGPTKMGWLTSSKLYILSASYKRDSSTSVVTADSCMNTVIMEPAPSPAGRPIGYCDLRYETRATDVTQAGFTIRFDTRYTGSGMDTTWVLGGNHLLWDTVHVVDTITNVHPSTSAVAFSRTFNVPSGAQLRACVKRTNVGAGDTVVIQNPWIRCW